MYQKTEWKTGDVVSSEKLNKIENGISTLDFFSMAPAIRILNDGTGKSWGEPYDITMIPNIDQELLDKWKIGGFGFNVIEIFKNGDREWIGNSGYGRIYPKYDSGQEVGYYFRVIGLDLTTTNDDKFVLMASLKTYEYSFDTGLWTTEGNTKYASPDSNFVFS